MDCSWQYALIVFPLHLTAASNCKNSSFVILIQIVEFQNRLQRYSFSRNSTICTLAEGYDKTGLKQMKGQRMENGNRMAWAVQGAARRVKSRAFSDDLWIFYGCPMDILVIF